MKNTSSIRLRGPSIALKVTPAGDPDVIAPSEEHPHGAAWQQIAYTGKWEGHHQGAFSMTSETFKDIIKNFAADPRGEVNCDFEHTSETLEGSVAQKGALAPAWVKKLELRGSEKEPALWGLFAWTDAETPENVRSGKIKYVSPAIQLASVHGETGKPSGARLSSVALTNNPFLSKLPALRATAREHADARQMRVGYYYGGVDSRADVLEMLRSIFCMEVLASEAEILESLEHLESLCKDPEPAETSGIPLAGICSALREALGLPALTDGPAVCAKIREALEKFPATESEHHSSAPPPSVEATQVSASLSPKSARLPGATSATAGAKAPRKSTMDEAAKALAARTEKHLRTLADHLKVSAGDLSDDDLAGITEATQKLVAERDALVAKVAEHEAAQKVLARNAAVEKIAMLCRAGIVDADDKDAQDELVSMATTEPERFERLYGKRIATARAKGQNAEASALDARYPALAATRAPKEPSGSDLIAQLLRTDVASEGSRANTAQTADGLRVLSLSFNDAMDTIAATIRKEQPTLTERDVIFESERRLNALRAHGVR